MSAPFAFHVVIKKNCGVCDEFLSRDATFALFAIIIMRSAEGHGDERVKMGMDWEGRMKGL